MLTRCLGCMEEYDPALGVCPHCGFVPGTPAEEAIHMNPGTVLHGRYLIGKVLGYGGFGVTYIGWDSKLEQKVAIKEYLPGEFSTRMPGRSQVSVFSGDKAEQFADGMHKFVEEARRLARFQNEPGIVTVFDSFEENNTAYIVMEYLDGETLTERLKRDGKIQEDEAVAMLLPLMESLEKVHAEGILHRDIAPDNIFLTTDGQVKLIDFGAARYATTSHSRSLTVIIKPGYSPEEQYRSRGDQGPHTDVYALGATLYKMITGVTPPDAMERRAKYESQSKDILVPPQKNAKGLSVTRRNAILNAMNVRIEDRTPDVETLIKELNADKPAKLITGKIKKIDVYAWPLWLKVLLPALGAIALAVGALLLTGVISFNRYSDVIVMPDGTVQVPDVEGLTSEESIRVIKNNLLDAVAGGNIQSEYAPAGYIVFQDPAAGSYVPVNSKVTVVVSAGTGVIPPYNGVATVPYVEWDTLAGAKDKLSQAGFAEPEVEEVYDDYCKEGCVVSISREAGEKLKVDSVLTLKLSKGPKPFALQNVVGMSEEEARKALEGRGLTVTTESRTDSVVEKGRVMEQYTPEGTMVRKGDTVGILVSKGKPYNDLANVVGKMKDEVVTILNDQNFIVKTEEVWHTSIPAGQVISQKPEAGKTLVEGTEITITVSKGKHMLTLAFNANSGSVSESSRKVEEGKAYGKLPTPTRKGYAFDGWFTAASGGSKVSESTAIGGADTTVYAHWTKIIKLTFNANGGSVSEGNRNVRQGAAYGNMPTPMRSGYAFDGWFTAASGGNLVNASTTAGGADTAVYAHWTKLYKLTFNANGGSVNESTRSLKAGATYGTLPTPTRSGFAFNGWFTAASGGSAVSTSTKMGSADTTIYAQWTVVHTLSFNANGGSVSEGSRSVKEGATYGTLPTPSRSGYTFKGWFTAADGGSAVSASTKMGTANVTVYAHWEKKSTIPAVGSYITFGYYGGQAIEWRVLAVSGTKVFVISRYGLDAKLYNETDASVTWETCTLRVWLNNSFYNNAFSAAEKGRIQTTTVQNNNNPTYGTAGGNTTYDKVFLLSLSEASTYFKSDSERKCYPMERIKNNIPHKADGICRWWLRSPGVSSNRAEIIDVVGNLGTYGVTVDFATYAVRPALWYDLGS